MATVALTAVWLTSRLDYTQSLQVQTTGIVAKHSLAGDVRTYAGGRRRLVILAGSERAYDMQLRLVPRATTTTLDAWLGTVVLMRDAFGTRRWVTFLGFERTQEPFPDLSDVKVTFVEVTVDESV